MSEDRGPLEVLLEDITGRLFRLQEKRSSLLASIRAIEPEMLDLLRREQELLKVLVRLKQVETKTILVAPVCQRCGRICSAWPSHFDPLPDACLSYFDELKAAKKASEPTCPIAQELSRQLYQEDKPPAPEAEGFVARKVYAPAAEVERKYGLPPGTLLPDAKKEPPAPEANAVITRQFPAEMAEEIKKQFDPLLELIVGPVDLAPEAEADEPQRINWKEFLG